MASTIYALIWISTLPLFVLLLVRANVGSPPEMVAASSSDLAQAYLKRGSEVEEHYQCYSTRLQTAYRSLLNRLEEDAPQLAEDLEEDPPKRVRYGYQMLPQILPESPVTEPPPPPSSTFYSWPHTDRMIEREARKISALLEEDLEAASKVTLAERIPPYKKMIADYRKLKAAHRQIDHHIQHNRLWQSAVAQDKARFKKGTFLHDTVVEREAILSALGARDEATFRKRIGVIRGIDATKTRPELEPQLRALEQGLVQQIGKHSSWFKPQPYVRVVQPEPHVWVIQVPMSTDIESGGFVQSFKDSIEAIWHVKEGGIEFRVELSITHVSSEELYRDKKGCREEAPRECRAPDPGASIDVQLHVDLFPKDGGALTTGGNSTYVKGTDSIVLGAEAILPRTLAHEFGHVLGFSDQYFRGYRDLGVEGYEIVEITPYPKDIMSSSGYGEANRFHFETIIEAAAKGKAKSKIAVE